MSAGTSLVNRYAVASLGACDQSVTAVVSPPFVPHIGECLKNSQSAPEELFYLFYQYKFMAKTSDMCLFRRIKAYVYFINTSNICCEICLFFKMLNNMMA